MSPNAPGRPAMEWTFNYEDLARITGKSINSIQASRRRPGGFDPSDLWSVVLWVARNVPPEKKFEIITHASSIPIVVENRPRRKGLRKLKSEE